MTGGISAPPELAAACTPAAATGLNPALRIMGIVKVPVVAVFATALPDSDPINPLLRMATLAGPPGLLPNMRCANSTMNRVAPVASRNAPKITNRKTYVNITCNAIPKMPWLWRNVWATMRGIG